MSTDVDERAVARAVVDRVGDDHVVLRLPHTEYRLRFALAAPASAIDISAGKRIRGTITGRALRIHPASAGGCFIEPVVGEPRIVAGRVVALDEPGRRVLVDAAVPMWLELEENQDPGLLRAAGLVNCHVMSGATFTPLV